MSITVRRLDHLVLTVRDLSRALDFYTRVLGMEAIAFGEGRRALRFGDQKINLHVAGREFEPKARDPRPGSADLCFVTDDALGAVGAHLEAEGVPIVEGPIERTGAVGPITSLYVRDPDGNLIEIAHYADRPATPSRTPTARHDHV